MKIKLEYREPIKDTVRTLCIKGGYKKCSSIIRIIDELLSK